MTTTRAIGVREFGGIDRMHEEQLEVPVPAAGQVLVHVHAAGVGPWDAWVRAGMSVLHQALPLVLGSDFSGVVEGVGAGVTDLRPGDEVFGVTNDEFTGAYAEHALAAAGSIARKPARLSHVEAASVPVVATTAWRMLFERAKITEGQRVLVLGAAGNVGAYAVQLARQAGAEVFALGRQRELPYLRSLRPALALAENEGLPPVDVVIDTVGGELLARSFDAIHRGGVLVSAAEPPDAALARSHGVRAVYFIVQVRTDILRELARRIDAGELTTNVGEVLELSRAREAHEMLAGRPHRSGKIVLRVDPSRGVTA